MITWLLQILGIIAVKLWEIAWTAIKKEVANAINNKALQNLAVSIVDSLKDKDMTNREKRDRAAELLKAQALALGMDIKDSIVNTLVELAVVYIKNKE